MLCKIKLSEKNKEQNGGYFILPPVQTGSSQSLSPSIPLTGQVQNFSAESYEKMKQVAMGRGNKLSTVYTCYSYYLRNLRHILLFPKIRVWILQENLPRAGFFSYSLFWRVNGCSFSVPHRTVPHRTVPSCPTLSTQHLDAALRT